MLANVSSTIFMSGRLAPSTASPIGMPWPSTSRLRLVPFLARSVGFLPVFFPPEGRLGHAPVHAQPLPVNALQTRVFQQSGLPQRRKDPRSDPLLEAVVRRGPRAELGGVQRFPLAAGAEHEQDGVHADPVGGAWSSTPKRWVFTWRGKCISISGHKLSGMRQSSRTRSVSMTAPSNGSQLPETKCSCTQLL